ncbi:uncharacterized protein HMPREF1541_03504 [Cyphellophora europaea CBS 101466]|uniref:Phosphatidylglycerol lysyltransferase C-terminal domain-containing protein n=1 Tax=Cyphellophora europaea (strain CBS 101466) TaxID=1220924 RepID=W2S0K2_CYPE1|nr:uncharacterized protein HMPREF1541_03504 [Cyphellophora europaea CBS 101466]ETN41568.1 hypothetical protein HMPREF1541_03504 [Cyphellophora europaea CBS 101466]
MVVEGHRFFRAASRAERVPPIMPSSKQPKVPAARPLFHEALGRELSNKFLALSTDPRTKSSISDFFNPEPAHEPNLCLETIDGTSLRNGVAIAAQILTAPSQVMLPRELSLTQDKKPNLPGCIYKLDDLNALQVIERLLGQYGRMTHMGVRDHAYQFFLNPSRTGVVSYRLIDRVAVVSGDPICPISRYQSVLEEFQNYCRTRHWQYAITGASAEMARISKELGWTTVQFARERALDVRSNPVLLGGEGKRIRTQCKQLMKSGTQLSIYCPTYQRDLRLEQEISDLYETWRAERNDTRSVQAYVTVFDLFSLHRLMVFIYSQDPLGKINGFAALRKLKDGYHVDPLIARANAPRGMVDLLLVASMAFLREAGVQRLLLGVEPLEELGEISGMSRALESLTRKSHKLVSNELPLSGKKGFNDRFRPAKALEEQLFLVYPNSPSMRQSVAMAHFANISFHAALKQKCSRKLQSRMRRLPSSADHSIENAKQKSV